MIEDYWCNAVIVDDEVKHLEIFIKIFDIEVKWYSNLMSDRIYQIYRGKY